MLDRAINCAIESSRISMFVVSSEDEEILRRAQERQATTHVRTPFAASDEARASDVVKDFVDNFSYSLEGKKIVYLQPTSPFRTASHVDRAIAMLERSNAGALVSVGRNPCLPEKSVQISEFGTITVPFASSDPGGNRQGMQSFFAPNGAIYIFDILSFSKNQDVPIEGAIAFKMGKIASLDIDDSEDLTLARGVASIA